MVFSFCYIRLKMELLVICNTSIVILRPYKWCFVNGPCVSTYYYLVA
jgi:hypothetical protein